MRLLLLLIGLYVPMTLAAPRVVTSILPLQELTAAIMDGVGQPEVVIGGEASPHHFAFKPSQLRRLQQADLVIWIDRDFESGFNRIDEMLPPGAARLELLPALDIHHGDGHLWYSPSRLRQSASFIVAQLVELDPVNRPVYEENGADLRRALNAWEKDMKTLLLESGERFITDHQFLFYFARDFGLGEIVSVHDQHDDHGGIKELSRIERYLREESVQCLLSHETGLSPLVQSLTEKYGLTTVTIDPGEPNRLDRQSTLRRLERLRRAVEACGR